jgi:hypothetical protein
MKQQVKNYREKLAWRKLMILKALLDNLNLSLLF